MTNTYTLHTQICHLSYLVILASINKFIYVQTLSSTLSLINFQLFTFDVLFIIHYHFDDIYKYICIYNIYIIYIYNDRQCLNTFRYILISSPPATFSYETKYKSSQSFARRQEQE